MSTDRITTSLQERGEAACVGESLADALEAANNLGIDPRDVRIGLQGIYVVAREPRDA